MQSIRFFGSPDASPGRQLRFGEQTIAVEPLQEARLQDLDLVIASTPDDVAARAAPWVVRQGGILVDESAAHRMRNDVPLVIPEVNPQAIHRHRGIIASPNCSTTQLAMCLKPILDTWGIRRVVVSTYQAASGAGQAAERELRDGSQALLSDQACQNTVFEHPLPFNLWPKIGSLDHDGFSSEELKMVRETRKILESPQLSMIVTCVRVPVFNGHSETVVVETERPATAAELKTLLHNSAGITVVDGRHPPNLPNPRQCQDRDEVFVGRIRRDPSVPQGLAFWCVSDNLRKGAATNAVQIAELVWEHRLGATASGTTPPR